MRERRATDESAWRRAASARAARRRGFVSVSRAASASTSRGWQRRVVCGLQDQGLGQGFDRERAQRRLGHLRLTHRCGEQALLPQPFDGDLDAVGLARLAEIRPPRDEVAQRARVLLCGTSHLQQATGGLDPGEGQPRPGTDLPGQAFGIGPQDVGGTVACGDASASRAGPGK